MLAGLLLTTLASACDRGPDPAATQTPGSEPTRPLTRAPIAASAAPPAAEAAEPARVAEPPPVPTVTPCPEDMVLVEGEFCPVVEQRCLQRDPDSSRQNERCLRFAQPTVCVSKARQLLRFCVDRFEWPNHRGEKPRVLTSWSDAGELCKTRGKRLCSEHEWLFACEGPDMLPYTYGFDRDPTACVIDRLYVAPQAYQPWERCLADEQCRAAFERIDQREPAGGFDRCQSPFGVFDMNGNANEWVSVPGERYPRRSGIKGGWWGPVRNRCRPTVRFHKEDDWGYEVGFRCCQDSLP